MKKTVSLYGILLSLVFVLYGSLDLLCGVARWFIHAERLANLLSSLSLDVGGGQIPTITLDPGMGLTLLVIGFSFLYGGFGSLKAKLKGGESFVLMGSVLTAILLILQALILVADGVEAYVLRIEDFSGWTPMEDLNEGLILGLLAMPIFSSSFKRLKSSEGCKNKR